MKERKIGDSKLYYTKSSFSTAARFPFVARGMIDFPRDIRGKVIVDIGSGASDITACLREAGAHALAIDFRYRNLDELKESVEEYFAKHSTDGYRHVAEIRKRRQINPTLLNRVHTWLIERVLDLGGGGYILQSQRAYDNFLRDIQSQTDGRYVAAYAEDLPFGDGTVDFCFSLECLTAFTIHDKNALIESTSEAVRILKPGGEFQIYPWLGGNVRWSNEERKNGQALLRYLQQRKINYEVEPIPDAPRLRIRKN